MFSACVQMKMLRQQGQTNQFFFRRSDSPMVAPWQDFKSDQELPEVCTKVHGENVDWWN